MSISRPLLALLLILPCAALAAACGETDVVTTTKTVTVTKTETVTAPATGDDGAGGDQPAVDPTKSTDEATVDQVATEATSKPTLSAANYSPTSWTVSLRYETRSGLSGIGCSVEDQQLVCTTSIGATPTKVLYLDAPGSVTAAGATFAWQIAMAKGKAEPVITVGGVTARGSQLGANPDDKPIPGAKVTVKQVVALAAALEDVAVEVA